MAKYDYGGGCPCGLYRDCLPQCENYRGEMPQSFITRLKESQSMTEKKEAVDHPEHYSPGTYEAINVIEAHNLDFHRGNAVKYILRAGKKDPNKIKEDIDKAIWYLNRYKDKL